MAHAANATGEPAAPVQERVWADFVETNFPFFSSPLDARQLGPEWPVDNLTPRGIILNLGNDCWACFDIDLLRISAIWMGKSVTPVSMSQVSYHTPGAKALEGEKNLSRLMGEPWLANGIYPGWQTGSHVSLVDPREPGPDLKEVGRGPLSRSEGRFRAIHLLKEGVRLEYEVAGATVNEWVEARWSGGQRIVQRRILIEKAAQPLWLVLGRRPLASTEPLNFDFATTPVNGKAMAAFSKRPDGLCLARVEASPGAIEFRIAVGVGPGVQTWDVSRKVAQDEFPSVRWPQVLKTHASLSSKQAYVVDNIPLPLDNPWKRNIRLADVAFFRDGRAAAVTFDGDVWLISGLSRGLQQVQWKRFASGLHEPLSLAIRDDQIFVFDRNGIWRLVDSDGNGEADIHELFSNAFAQTAETREYANGMKVAPDGSFIIAKGGIQMETLGKHNGSVLRISPDGQSISVLGYGLRGPFIGVHPKTGLITASDQQGNYVPTTPLQIIRDHQFYGFLSNLLPKEQYPEPVADPLTWIPYPVNASGGGQVWLTGARMGPLNDSLIHIGYYRPEIFAVLLNTRSPRTQAAVVSITRDFEFAPLNGSVNPVDGQLYVAGFQIFGTTARQISGLARLRYTGAPSLLPREIIPADKGILLRFDVALDPKKATDPANFSAERWNYRRTFNYGSPHFKPDGSKGQEVMRISSAYLSKDKKAVFIGIPGMKPVMQMRVGWNLAAQSGATMDQNGYFTPYELTSFHPTQEGFEPVEVDLTPKERPAIQAAEISAGAGKSVAELMGCVACHSNDGSVLGKVGPTWKGLFGNERQFADGSKAVADENYIRQSIREPGAKVVRGFEKSDTAMPSYEGVASDAQIESLVLYIKSLR